MHALLLLQHPADKFIKIINLTYHGLVVHNRSSSTSPSSLSVFSTFRENAELPGSQLWPPDIVFWSKPGGRAKKGKKKKKGRGAEGGKTPQLCEFDLICQAFLSGKSISCDERRWMDAICGELRHSQDVFLKSLDKERKAGIFLLQEHEPEALQGKSWKQ